MTYPELVRDGAADVTLGLHGRLAFHVSREVDL